MATLARNADPDAGDGVLAGLRWAIVRDLKLALRTPSELGVQLLFYIVEIGRAHV